MELTTPQIYGFFATLTAAAIAGLIFYCIGLRTGRGAGYELGRESAAMHWRKLLKAKQEANAELHEQLANRGRELLTARANLITEAESHKQQLAKLRTHMHFTENDREGVIRDLLEELQHETTNRLTTDDWLNLKLAAKQLGIAAHQHARSGSTKTNQPAQAQACITALAERVKNILDQPPRLCAMADYCITDTDIIEWLNTNGDYWAEIDNATLRFDVNSPEEGFEHLRNVLTLAIQQKQSDTESATTTIGNWREQEAERAA